MKILEIRDQFKFNLICILPFLFTAFFSEGFLHPDEHYQILEMLNLKIGKIKDENIFNWDFHLYIRSWFQVGIYFLLSKVTFISNPFCLAFVIRLFNSIVGFISIYLIINYFCRSYYYKRLALFLTSFTWFVPYIFARTSSESLSTSLFLIGIYFFLKSKNKYAALSGVLWGISFACRFQMGISVFFAFFWSLLYKKNYKQMLISLLSLFFIIGISVLVDYWGYDKWTFAPYNYLVQNIIENKASSFGVSPFWYYLSKPFIKAVPPLTIFYLFSILYFWFKEKNSLLTYVTLGFFIIHSIIGHKEVRFLSFLYILAPLFLCLILEKNTTFNLTKYKKIFKFSFVINLLVLIKTSFTPAHSGLSIYKFMYNRPIERIYVLEKDGRKFNLTMPFYLKNNLKTLPYVENTSGLLITTKYNEYIEIKKKSNCSNIFLSYPGFVLAMNPGNWLSRSGVYAAWKCKKKS